MQSGELSRLAGISTDTLRHNEHLGVLPKPPRTNGGYRDYPANSLDRVRLVQSALRVGFTLPELATILKMRDRGDAPCHRVRAVAEHKLEQVKQQINDLIGMRNQVERILKDWDALLARTGNGKQARLLESLPHDVIGTNSRRLTPKHLRRSQR